MIEAALVAMAIAVLAAQWWARASIRGLDRLSTGKLPTGEATARTLLDACGLPGTPVREGRRDGFDALRGAVVLSEAHGERRSFAAVAVAAHTAALAVVLDRAWRRAGWVLARLLARAGGLAVVAIAVLIVLAPGDVPAGVPLVAMACALLGAAICVSVERSAHQLSASVLERADLPAGLRGDLRRVAFSAAIGGLAGAVLPAVPAPRWPAGTLGAGPGHGAGIDGIQAHGTTWVAGGGHSDGGGFGGGGGDSGGGGGGAW